MSQERQSGPTRVALDRVAVVTGTSGGVGAASHASFSIADGSWLAWLVGRRRSPHSAYQHVAFDLATVAARANELRAHLAPHLERPGWRRIGLVNNAADAGQLAPVAELDPAGLVRLYTVNTMAPVWLMGAVLGHCPQQTTLRIVNVSTGAASQPFPGLADYASSKAALRMAGMSLATEWGASATAPRGRQDAAILSYEPGIVDTDMQRNVRAQSPERFPLVGMFRTFASQGLLVPPARPAADIVAFLESDGQSGFLERRLQSSLRSS